ncbi:MAG: universal stress protein [Fluviicola sp.]
MKKILVPIDFSKVSENALDYAVELAQRVKKSLKGSMNLPNSTKWIWSL